MASPRSSRGTGRTMLVLSSTAERSVVGKLVGAAIWVLATDAIGFGELCWSSVSGRSQSLRWSTHWHLALCSIRHPATMRLYRPPCGRHLALFRRPCHPCGLGRCPRLDEGSPSVRNSYDARRDRRDAGIVLHRRRHHVRRRLGGWTCQPWMTTMRRLGPAYCFHRSPSVAATRLAASAIAI